MGQMVGPTFGHLTATKFAHACICRCSEYQKIDSIHVCKGYALPRP